MELAPLGSDCMSSMITGRASAASASSRHSTFRFRTATIHQQYWSHQVGRCTAWICFSGSAPLDFKATAASSLADTTPTTLPRSSTNAPPELPGCTGTLIWKYRASSPAPESDAISPLASLGAKPCKPMLGNPTVATVPPNFTARLAATGNGENLPSAFNNARSLAASTFTSLAEIKPALVTKRICAAFLTTRSFVTRNPSSEMKKPVPLPDGFKCAMSLLELDEPEP